MNIIPYVSNDFVIDEADPSDKEKRLQHRKLLDRYEVALQDLFGSKTGEMDQINEEGLTQELIDGVYIRCLVIQPGISIVSKIWKRERYWIIATGEVTFRTEFGTQRVKAPFTKIIQPGSKTALYAHETTMWFAISATDAKELEDVENDVLAKDYSDVIYPWENE